MEQIQLNPNRFNIYDVWEDCGDIYVTVEVAPNMFVDVKYASCTKSDLMNGADEIYSYPIFTVDGGYVYSADSAGFTVADISDDDAWEVVYFVDDEICNYLG